MDDLFARFDANKDGKLDWEEIWAACEPLAPKIEAKIAKAFDGPWFKCTGEWDPKCRAAFDEQMAYYADPNAPPPEATQAFADMFRQGMDYFIPKTEEHAKYDKLVSVTTETVDGLKYHKQASECEALVHRVAGATEG